MIGSLNPLPAEIERTSTDFQNLIKRENFPGGFYLSANTRVWEESSTDSWLETRIAASGHEREVA